MTMGLDVYLYKNKDHKKFKALHKKMRELEDNDQYDSDEFKKLEAEAETLEERVKETPSSKYPDHLCNLGYLRSSYNSGGMNSVLRRTIGKDLYDIFDPPEGEYFVAPDWEACLKRAKDTLKEFQDYVELKGGFDVMEVSHNSFVSMNELPKDSGTALEIFFKQYEQNKKRVHNPAFDDGYNWYSNREGEYFMGKQPAIIAAIPGVSVLKSPCMFLVYKKDKADFDFYTQALEIVVEMCEWVLKQDEPDLYTLHWSG